MSFGLQLLAGLSCFACLAWFAVPSASADDVTPVERHGQLRIDGTHLVDQHGEPVMLRGMSLFWSQWGGKYYTPEAIAWLVEDWEISLLRVAVAVDRGGYLEHPEQEMAKAVTAIDAAIAQGIYVIVDWHAHDPEPEAAVEFFTKIAETYGHHPNLIYETWNEPLRHHDWSTVIKPYHERVVAAIRKHDPDNVVVLGTQTWSQDVDKAAADPVDGDNLAYTLHFYAGSHKQSLRDKADAALARGVALFATEWGTTAANGDDGVFPEETRRWMDYLDRHRISWCNWSVFDKEEDSAALLPGAATTGGWPEDGLTRSGRLVRDYLRRAERDE